MEDKDIRWKQRFMNFEKAYLSLKDISVNGNHSDEEILIEATVKRFELAFELAWKTLQDYLREMGYIDYKGPTRVLAKSLQDGILEDREQWEAMREERNLLSHTYNYDQSRLIYKNIISLYVDAIEKLYNKLKNETA